MNEAEHNELMDFLDVVDLKIKLDKVVDKVRKELIVDYELNDNEILFVVSKIKERLLNGDLRVCPANDMKVIGEDCGNCIAYGDFCSLYEED